MTSVGLFFLSVLAATLSRIFATEIEAWGPSIITHLIKLAVKRLPGEDRERFEEEWQSHVSELPGTIAKLFTATGFIFAAYKMARASRIIPLLTITLRQTDLYATVGQTLVEKIGKVEGGVPPYSLKLDSGTQLPPGLSLSIDENGNIRCVGVPVTPGKLEVRINVSDSGSDSRHPLRILLRRGVRSQS